MGDLGMPIFDALVLVDMQKKFVKKLPPYTRDQVVDAQRQIITYCAQNDLPVVALEYKGCGKTLDVLWDVLVNVPRKIVYEKDCADGFLDTPIERVLRSVDAKRLCFAGMNASACVRMTAQSAHDREFSLVTSIDLLANEHNRAPDYPAWYEQHGVCYPDYTRITGGRLVEPTPEPKSLLARLKNAFA